MIVLVFLVRHIKLVYLAFFILICFLGHLFKRFYYKVYKSIGHIGFTFFLTEEKTSLKCSVGCCGGYSHVKVYGDVLQKRVSFYKKSLHMSPILVKKSLEVGPISRKLQKRKYKISHFLRLKIPLEWVQICKNWEKQYNWLFSEIEKSLDIGKGFRPTTAHSIKNKFEYLSGMLSSW